MLGNMKFIYICSTPWLAFKASSSFRDQLCIVGLGETGVSWRFGAALHFISKLSHREVDQAEW